MNIKDVVGPVVANISGMNLQLRSVRSPVMSGVLGYSQYRVWSSLKSWQQLITEYIMSKAVQC